MKYKVVKQSDLEDILKIENECFLEPWDKDAFMYDIENKNPLFIKLVDDDNNIIGYYDAWTAVDDADIGSIAIRKKYQGKGYGERLLKNLLTRCKKQGVKTVHLEVRIDNTKAKNLYEKLGFTKTRIRKGYYNGIDAIEMMKGL